MKKLRLILALMLSLGLLTNGTASAYSQAQMAGSQSIVICSPNGAHEIILGVNGTPITMEHECQDCCLSFVDTPSPLLLPLTSGLPTTFTYGFSAHQLWLNRTTSSANARAPPQIV